MAKITHLQAAREQSGKTQAQVAADLDMSVRSYQSYEYGMGAQTIQNAIRIAQALGVKDFDEFRKLWGDSVGKTAANPV